MGSANPAVRYLLLVLLSGCTIVGHHKTENWPVLDIVEHYVPEKEMREVCSKYVSFGMSPQACAEFRFEFKRCDIWFSSDFPPTQSMIEHERLHCQGYDHLGSDYMASLLK